MRELNHAILGLEEWNEDTTCDFCDSNNRAVCQIISRSKVTGELIAGGCACEDCKNNFDELPRCDRCGRLEIRVRFVNSKYLCACIRYNENLEEKELPTLSNERSGFARHEERIGELQNELVDAKTEIDTHLEALDISKDWHEKQKQELLDEIARLRQENGTYKERIENLEELLKQLNLTEKLENKIEQSPKTKPWKQLFNKKN